MNDRPCFCILGALLVLGLCVNVMGCGDDTENKPESGPDCECEENWVREQGSNGRLYQAVEITFNVPDEYEGPTNPYMVGSAFAADPSIPVMNMPPLMGEADQDATLIPGKPYTYKAAFHNRCSTCRELPCCQFYYLAINIYEHEISFPTAGEWIYMSEELYQVGGDPIVIGPVDLVPGLVE